MFQVSMVHEGPEAVWRVSRGPTAPNVFVVAGREGLVLIDAGAPAGATGLRRAVEALEKATGSPLCAVVLTHGHFDHTGGLLETAARRNVAVLAHPEEIPFITGERSYASAPGWWGYVLGRWAGGKPVPGKLLKPVEEGGTAGPLVAYHTPGHTPGHLSFFHPATRTWFTGDLLLNAMGRLHGPIGLASHDPGLARRSALRLMEPTGGFAVLCPGHGRPVRHNAEEALRGYLRRFRLQT